MDEILISAQSIKAIPVVSDIWVNIVKALPHSVLKDHDDLLDAYILIGLIVIVIALAAVALNIAASDPPAKKRTNPVALNSEEFRDFPLIEKENISHDVIRLRFGLPTANHMIGLPTGQHISLKYTDEEGKEVIRSYTPTSSNDELGYVDFVVKVYFKLLPQFPNGGKMSQYLNGLKIGDKMSMRGPKGHLDYLGRGKFTIKKGNAPITTYRKKKLGMIAGGTGITPMLQVIRAILKDPSDKTEMWLIFANKVEDDILLRKELESLQSNRFHLHYTLDSPPDNWNYSKGFINTAMCRDHLPPPGDDAMIFVCGPPPMIKYACEPAFKELGIQENQWFAF